MKQKINKILPEEHFLTINGLRHHVLSWDGGGNTTVLCLHGFLDSGWEFLPLASRLASAGFHVIAPDLRGHGDTDHVGPGGYYHFANYIFDVSLLADTLARKQLAVIGHSMGGMIASYYTGTFPKRVSRLVMMESISVPETSYEDIPKRTAKWILDVQKAQKRTPNVYPSLEAAAKRLQDFDPRCDQETALFLAEKRTQVTPEGRVFKYDPRHLTRGPYPFRLDFSKSFWQNITCPVLCFEAEESPFNDLPDLETRYSYFANLTRIKLKEANHMMIRHQPQQIASHLLFFLEGR